MHLSTSKINNSPHKLSFQISMRAGDQKLRYDLVWPQLFRNCFKYLKQKYNHRQVPLQDISSPFHEHGKCGTPFLSTTKVKSVPLPVLYIKRQHSINNKGVRNVPLCSNRYAPIPKRTRLRSDSLLDLHHEKKRNKLHEHLVEGKYNLEHSRLLKLQSEMIPHRLNHGYYMSGKVMSLKDRYAVPEEELLRLRKLTLSANAELYYGKGMR